MPKIITIKQRIKELEEKLTQASKDYYNSSPTISDKVYDAWKDELTKLDPSNPAVVMVGAPVAPSEWKKYTHEVPMGSLNKVNEFAELQAWAKECSANKLLVTEKLDGLSISLKYVDGGLVCGVTRGSGEIGEEITPNVRKMEGVQTRLPLAFRNFNGHIRGEIVLRRSNHKKYFSEYANPRNAASGISKRLDGKGNEHLTVICYSIEGEDYDTEQELFKALDQMGFLTPTYKTGTLAEVLKTYEQYQDEIRDTLDYDIDGLVIRVDDRADQLALGEKNHRPKGAIAFKFDAAMAESILRDIVWQVGDTGRITPVATIDSVNVAGVTIDSPNLHNVGYVNELNLFRDCRVLVSRRNDVAPYIEENLDTPNKASVFFHPPKKCPVCGSLVISDGAYIRCSNTKECPAQVLGRINKWVKELGILEWGAKQIQKMIDAGLVVDVADIYRLKANDIAGLDKLGDKSAQNLITELDKYREVTLENLIGGLTINGIATSSVKLVTAAGYDKLDDLFKITEAQLVNIPGFGSIRAEAFVTGMAENRKRIEDILSAGVKIKAKVKGVLSGRSFCFTGTMSTPRAKLQKMVEDAGGDVKNSVGKGLSYLIIADPASTSSKAKAARKFGTVLLSEAEFAKLVSG